MEPRPKVTILEVVRWFEKKTKNTGRKNGLLKESTTIENIGIIGGGGLWFKLGKKKQRLKIVHSPSPSYHNIHLLMSDLHSSNNIFNKYLDATSPPPQINDITDSFEMFFNKYLTQKTQAHAIMLYWNKKLSIFLMSFYSFRATRACTGHHLVLSKIYSDIRLSRIFYSQSVSDLRSKGWGVMTNNQGDEDQGLVSSSPTRRKSLCFQGY